MKKYILLLFILFNCSTSSSAEIYSDYIITTNIYADNERDYMLHVNGATIRKATGRFDYYSTSGLANNQPFSIQLNTNFGSYTDACIGGSRSCTVWQQFVYNSSGYLIIWYWLLNYQNECPVGWEKHSNNCIRHSKIISAPKITPRDIGKIIFTAKTSKRSDTLSFSYKGKSYTLNSDPNILGIRNVWNSAEYNILGDGNGRRFNFEHKTHIVVNLTTNITNNNGKVACVRLSTTAETNNLNLGSCVSKSINNYTKSIQFEQFN